MRLFIIYRRGLTVSFPRRDIRHQEPKYRDYTRVDLIEIIAVHPHNRSEPKAVL